MNDGDGFEGRVRKLLDEQRAHEAAAEVVRRYGAELRSYLVHVLRDATAADDAFSECAEQIWRSLASFAGESSVRAWAYGVAWHSAMRVLRDPFRRRGRQLDTGELSGIVAAVRTETPVYQQTGPKDAIDELRASLTPDERALLVLRLDRKLAWSEVASALRDESGSDVSEATLRKRFERIKAQLRALAERKGLLAPR